MLEHLLKVEKKQVLLSPNLRKQQTEPSLTESEVSLNLKPNKQIISEGHSRKQSRTKSRYEEDYTDNEEQEQVDASSLLSFHREGGAESHTIDKKTFQTAKET